MRRAAQLAAAAVLVAVAAYEGGAYVRGDYRGDEPGRDIAVGLSALAVAVGLGWALDGPKEGADGER